jgi:hypothetical protein
MDNRMENEGQNRLDNFILSKLAMLQPVNLSGVIKGLVLISPFDTLKASEMKVLKNTPYLKVKTNLKAGARSLGYEIYHSGLEFPDYCVTCMKPAEKYALAETTLTYKSRGKFEVQERQEQANKIYDALFSRRYWYAIPYCHEHGSASQSISFSNVVEIETYAVRPDIPQYISFNNLEYASLFMKTNHLTGVWADRSSCGDVLFNNPEEEIRLNSTNPDWKQKLVHKRVIIRAILAVIFFAINIPALIGNTVYVNHMRALAQEYEPFFLQVLFFSLMILLPLYIFAKKIGNFPFGKEGQMKDKSRKNK